MESIRRHTRSAGPEAGRRRTGFARRALLLAGLLAAGCETFHGPSIEFTAPRVSGRVIDAASGQPVGRAQVGRKFWSWRKGTAEFVKGAEAMVLLHEYAFTDADGRFMLPQKEVALLFSIGDVGLNLSLTVQHDGHAPWRTNYAITNLGPNAAFPEINAGDIPIHRR